MDIENYTTYRHPNRQIFYKNNQIDFKPSQNVETVKNTKVINFHEFITYECRKLCDTRTHRQRDRYLQKINKSSSNHLKTYKSSKNRKSKFFTKEAFSYVHANKYKIIFL